MENCGLICPLKVFLSMVYKKEYPFRTLNVWVNSSGDVVGQQLVEDNGTGYTYKYVINQGNFGFEAFSTKKNKVLSNVRASGTVSGNSVTGNLKYFTDSGIERLSVDFIDINVILPFHKILIMVNQL